MESLPFPRVLLIIALPGQDLSHGASGSASFTLVASRSHSALDVLRLNGYPSKNSPLLALLFLMCKAERWVLNFYFVRMSGQEDSMFLSQRKPNPMMI